MAKAFTPVSGLLHRRHPSARADKTQAKGIKRLDSAFVLIILVLLTYGLIMVFSASYPSALQKTQNSMHFIQKQALFVVVGLVAMFLISLIDYHLYRRFVIPITAVGLILLVLVLIPGIGTDLGTFARRWIGVGDFTFQPSEIMKFATIVLFAHLISINYKRMGTFRYGVLPFAVMLAVTAGLMLLEPHLSGTILIFAIGLIMMFVGGTKLRWFAILGGVGAAGVGGLFLLGSTIDKFAHITERITYWLDPFQSAEVIRDQTWQTVQSLVAIGSGGVLGRGIGNSRQKYLYIPEPHNDFIFAIICEELGLIGALIVIVLFIMFALRGFSIAAKAPDKFGYMLGVGLTAQIIIQAILNIAVVTNTIPNTGISLPFFSYGGTAILMQLGQMGILLNISRHSMIEKT